MQCSQGGVCPLQTTSAPLSDRKPNHSHTTQQPCLQPGQAPALTHLQHCLELCILQLANVVIVVQVIYKAQQAALLILLDSLSLQACTVPPLPKWKAQLSRLPQASN